MSEETRNCPKCNSPYGYKDGNLWICPECFYEWTAQQAYIADIKSSATSDTPQYLDVNGVQLQTGDTVTTIKDLKAGKDTIKSGTKVKNIKLLTEPIDGHDISCKLPEYGSIYLKCSVVKKVK